MIPFVDLKAQYRSIKDEVNAAIQGVIEHCEFTLGSEVAAFEKEFAGYCQVEHGIGVNTGTSALHLALLAAGVGKGDEVITVPFTFVATVSAIDYTGAKPVFVDIDPKTFTMDVNAIEAAITEKTKAIIPVHLYGQPADMDPILEIARKHNLVVIEDACQAHGAEYKGRRAGSMGHMGCFSFYPGKNLGAYGEGGMVVTNNPEFTRSIRMLRDWGAEKKYQHVLKGYNFRLEGIQGAVLRVKLKYLEGWTEARRTAAARYDSLLAGTGVPTPYARPDVRHVYHLYAIRTQNRQAWQDALLAQGIQTGIHYPTPVHLLPAFADLGYQAGQFPHSEKAANEVLSLPMFPELTAAQCERVAQAVQELATPAPAASEATPVGAA
ncbi:DegT/DnrJ/EryC1/StrS aminotransferase family protein [uncultured Azohydromonas sp.]|jgi:Predicted pyridoxal phosphate-dependent enzyme apparently involved in regulation of cell wall biogenesis|uniref:DegT/DnrJ/EryC1/StrS family aminotransferase n=1 Tax=uncultured Azohydromonas sp. TaxID=487342 RepID=UPI00260C0C53|nr:DegT/DnrJ/EryC1/StrS family aminotransferase [uncultured Azohydromonas sp.]